MKKIILVLLSSFVLAGCNRIDSHQPLSSHKLSFVKVDSIGQNFVAIRDNLNMVNICVRNSNRVLLPMEFALTNSKGAVVRKLNFDAGNIDNSDCTRFQFDPIPDSAGQSYAALLNILPVADLDAKEIALLKSGLFVEAHGGGDYLGGNAVVDGVESIYDLHFKTYYKQSLRNVIEESIKNFGVRLTQDLFFDIIFILLIIWIIKKYKVAK